LTTGKLLWQDELSVRKTGNYEVVRLLEIDNDSNLVVIGQIKSNDSISEQVVFHQDDLILFQRKYDSFSGELLEYFQRDFDDKEAFLMSASISRQAKHSYLFRENDLLRYIASVKINDTFYLRSLLLDDTGKKVGEESFLKFKYTTHYSNLIQLALDTFIHVEINFSDSTLLFRHLTADLQEFASYTTTKIRSTPEFLEFVKLSADKKKILFEYIDRDDPFFNFVELLVYDTKGNLIKQAALDNFNSNYFEVLKWEDDNDNGFTILKPNIIKDENNNRISIVNVSTYDDENGEYIINTFASTDPKRYAIPYNTIPLEGDKYFIQFGEQRNSTNFERDYGAFAISQMLLDGKTLFSPSSTEDVSESSRIALYPNPTIDHFTIAFDTEYSGIIQVYNVSGHLLLQKSVSHTLTEQIDITTLDAGLYVVHSIPSDHKRSAVTLKLVKME
jgi:Secretion system C-terminal sorting domain